MCHAQWTLAHHGVTSHAIIHLYETHTVDVINKIVSSKLYRCRVHQRGRDLSMYHTARMSSPA